MDDGEKKCLDDIEKYGCHILHILADGDLPPFSYSVGIEKSAGLDLLYRWGTHYESCACIVRHNLDGLRSIW